MYTVEISLRFNILYNYGTLVLEHSLLLEAQYGDEGLYINICTQVRPFVNMSPMGTLWEALEPCVIESECGGRSSLVQPNTAQSLKQLFKGLWMCSSWLSTGLHC